MSKEASFYHLTTTPLERALPKLMEKVHAKGVRAVVLCGDEKKLERLNDSLWSYSSAKFLPHGSKKDGFAEKQPIYLASVEENPNGAEVLVVTDSRVPGFVSEFGRCVDIFDGGEEGAALAAMERYRRYEEMGFSAGYWKQNSASEWVKEAV